jgi:hypothetical protein
VKAKLKKYRILSSKTIRKTVNAMEQVLKEEADFRLTSFVHSIKVDAGK